MAWITPEYAALLPAFVLVGVGAVLPLLGAFRVRPGVLSVLSAVALVAGAVLTLATVARLPGLGFMPDVSTPAGTVVSFELLEMTPFVVLFDLVFMAVALIVVLASPRYVTRRHQGEYYSLLLLSTVGMMMVAASRDLITLFIGLELSSFCTYALAGFFKRRLDSTEAAMKYFIVGSISSSLALFGISIVYGLAGSTSFEALSQIWEVRATGNPGDPTTYATLTQSGGFALGVFVWGLLLAGFGYKIALVPFHNYAVDVYEGAPSTVAGFVSAAGKHMGFAALFKVFLLGLFAIKANWDLAVGLIAIVTMVVGNVAALNQTNIKRMLAYSSIAQAGYILIALAVVPNVGGDYGLAEYALAGGLFHIVTYAFMNAGAFMGIAAASTWGVGEELSDWKGMGKRAPFLALCMAFFMLSFAGIPPLAGFASKFVLFSAAIQAGTMDGVTALYATMYIGLAVVGILTSAISLVYYWRVIRVMYVEESEGRRVSVASGAAIALVIALAGTIVLGLYPPLGLDLSLDAADSLFTTVQQLTPSIPR